jgi:hypothetical protein
VGPVDRTFRFCLKPGLNTYIHIPINYTEGDIKVEIIIIQKIIIDRISSYGEGLTHDQEIIM